MDFKFEPETNIESKIESKIELTIESNTGSDIGFDIGFDIGSQEFKKRLYYEKKTGNAPLR